MKLKRKPDWRSRLYDQLAKADKGIDQEKINCTIFVDDAVKSMTGKSLLTESGIGRGTPEEQYRSMRKAGFTSVEEAVGSVLEEVPPALGQVGDIAILAAPNDGVAFGVVIGAHIKALRPDGLPGVVDLLEAKKVYRV